MATTSMQTIRALHLHLLKHADKEDFDTIDKIVFKRFAYKVCYSLGRSTGANLIRNKWFLIIQLTYEMINGKEKADKFLDQMKQAACEYCRSYSLGLPRMRFMLDIIGCGVTATARTGLPSITVVVNRWQSNISEGDNDPRCNSKEANLKYISDFAAAYDLRIQDCGHYEEVHHRVMIRGDRTTLSYMRHVCKECGESISRKENRVLDNSGCLILGDFAVVVNSHFQRTYIQDRRSNSIRLVIHRGAEIWVDDYWNPYGNLLANYHSSRQGGFQLIESPWFKRSRRAFGIELEVQYRATSSGFNKKLADVHEALNHNTFELGEYCFFERDGSIGEGFEIVTQPAGLDVHTERLARFLTNSNLKRGLRSHEGGSCGLHIHVGRDFLTQAQIYRMQAFLNDARNEQLIRAIARRYDNGYSRIKSSLSKFTMVNKHSSDRYEALNITNLETVEFRIFRGSLRYESVIAALEFVNSLMTFCTPGSVSLTNFHADGYKAWLQLPENKVDTKILRSYLAIGGDHATNEREAA